MSPIFSGRKQHCLLTFCLQLHYVGISRGLSLLNNW